MNRRKFLIGAGSALVAAAAENQETDLLAENLPGPNSVNYPDEYYFFGSQWTAEEIAVLAKRGQPIIHYREGRVA